MLRQTPPHRAAVLVLGHDARMVLPIARSLGRRGIDVHVGWCASDDPALRSRYVTNYHPLPSCDDAKAGWVDAIGELAATHRYRLVLPATEPATYAFWQHREQLPEEAQACLPNERSLQVALDKRRTHQLATSLGIPVPPTKLALGHDALRDAFNGITLPAYVKPLCSVDVCDGLSKNFVRKVRSSQECSETLQDLHYHNAPFLVQEAVPGAGQSVEFLAHRGRLLFAFQHRRLHETIGHGSTYRKSVPLSASLLHATTQLVSALDYTGVGMCEFKLDDATGRWTFLELNARFWGSLPLALAAGADFPWYLYELLVHGKRKFPQSYRCGVRCRSLRADLRWTWRAFRRLLGNDANGKPSGDGWDVNELPPRQLVLDTARGLALVDHLDSFTVDDPWPGIYELTQLVRRRLTKIRKQPGLRDVPNSAESPSRVTASNPICGLATSKAAYCEEV